MARIEPGLVMDLHEHGVRLPPEQPNHTHASATTTATHHHHHRLHPPCTPSVTQRLTD